MLSGVSVHPADDLLGDVCELLLVCAVPHLPDALHGGLLVLGGQQLGLLQTLAAQHQPEVELRTKLHTQVLGLLLVEVPTSAFTFKNLSRHYPNLKLGC